MNNVPEIKDIDAAVLTGLVRQALGSPTAQIRHWEHHPVSYINTEKSILGIHRFKGIAHDQGEAHPWSIVLKAVQAPVNDSNPDHWNYHRREIFAYKEGLLASLPSSLSAPRCLGITEYTDGVCWLWLEDLLDTAGPSWSLADYNLAALHLGRFNGAYLTEHPLPVLPWLSQHWLRGWLSYYEMSCRQVLELMRDKRFWEHPLLSSAFPHPINDDVLQLWSQHDVLLATLDQLPRTFCHMDAYRPNLFIRRDAQGVDQLVAIDWVFAGIGAIGEEIANLLAASLIWFEYDAAEAKTLDEAIFTSYLEGLREEGWRGDPRLARLGYAAACALRWGLVGLWWLLSLNDPSKEADLEKKWRRPLPDLVSQWSKTTYYVLGMAQEAYKLKHDLF
jgi:hypothetical protein